MTKKGDQKIQKTSQKNLMKQIKKTMLKFKHRNQWNMQWNSPNLLKLSTYPEISILIAIFFYNSYTQITYKSKLLLSGLCVSYIFHTRLYVFYLYCNFLFVLWNNFFRYILFTTYHNYYYLVTTEIDLLLIYLCKSKNPSFVIPPQTSRLLWLST